MDFRLKFLKNSGFYYNLILLTWSNFSARGTTTYVVSRENFIGLIKVEKSLMVKVYRSIALSLQCMMRILPRYYLKDWKMYFTISSAQNAFVRGRQILDPVAIEEEKKMVGLLLEKSLVDYFQNLEPYGKWY